MGQCIVCRISSIIRLGVERNETKRIEARDDLRENMERTNSQNSSIQTHHSHHLLNRDLLLLLLNHPPL